MRFRVKLLDQPAEINYPKHVFAKFAVSCDDHVDPHFEHFHDDDGHTFPCTRADLIQLQKQIAKILT